MKSYLLAGLASLLLSIPVFAQIPTDSAIPLEYFNKHWYRVAKREAATFVRAYMGYDSAARLHKIHDYQADGRLLNAWHYNAADRYVREGLSTWYWVNNQPSRSGSYLKGKRSGQWTDYYRNGKRQQQYSYPIYPDSTANNDSYLIDNSWDSTGKAEVVKGHGIFRERNDSSGAVIQQGMVKNGLREGIWQGFDKEGQQLYEDEYQQGKFVKGKRFGENGTCIPYDSLFISAAFPGGTGAMMKNIYRTIRYPREEVEMGVEGTVIIGFIIDKAGNVMDVEVLRGVSALIDEEAMRVVRKLPAWTPGLQRGKPVAVAFRLPIRFALTEKQSKK